mmetsp:Transcript_62115/g.110402  ORF Transcript_62115/g.110402 Transcript_62115/m.110402 type:complete len:101 (-) Transcript_62115:556-858(-)
MLQRLTGGSLETLCIYCVHARTARFVNGSRTVETSVLYSNMFTACSQSSPRTPPSASESFLRFLCPALPGLSEGHDAGDPISLRLSSGLGTLIVTPNLPS